MDVCSVDTVREGQTVLRHGRLHTEQHAGGDSYSTSWRRWYIQRIMQEVVYTAHNAGSTTYHTSCRRWYIPHIMQEVIHTAHHAGGDTYSTSCRRWYIQHIMQEVIHTTHNAGSTTYHTSCRRWYIQHIMQEVIHITHNAGDTYRTSRHFEVSNLGDPTGYFLRNIYIRTNIHTHSYKHGISCPSVHFSSVLFIHL